MNLLSIDFSRFTQPNVLVGILLAVIGLACAILAKRVAKAIRKTDKVEEGDKYVLAFKIVGLILMLVALVVIVADEIML